MIRRDGTVPEPTRETAGGGVKWSHVSAAIRLALGAAAVGSIVFLGVKPTAQIEGFPFFPIRWARYLDARDDLRNVLAFLLLAIVVLGLVPFRWRRRHNRAFFLAVGFLLLLAPAFESVQHFLPGRRSDPRDLLTAWAGIALGFVVVGVLRWSLSRLRSVMRRPSQAQGSGDSGR